MRRVVFRDLIYRVKDIVDKDNTELEYYVGGEHFDSGEIQIKRRGTLLGSTIGPAFHMRFQPGDVLLMSRNPHLRKAAVATFEGICSDVSYVCRTRDESKLPQRLIPFIFQTDQFWEYATAHRHGSTNYFLNWKDFEGYEFLLPESTEIESICDLLWAFEHLKQRYLELLSSADALVQSRFVEMFEGRQDAVYHALADCCTSVSGGSTPSMKHEEYYGGDVPFIKSGDVKTDYVSSGTLWLTQKALEETTSKLIPRGSVIVVIRSGILKHDLPVAITSTPVVINQDIKAFEPKPGFTSQYIAWAIRSKQDILLSKTRAMTVDNIESKELFEIPVMVASATEQEQFSHFVEQTDKSKFAIRQVLDSLIKSRNSIMEKVLGSPQ